MATDPKDVGQTQTGEISEGAPTRPEAVPRSIVWPGSASMPDQNRPAHQTFQQNSERLQKAAEAKREAQSQEPPASESRELTFASDHGRGNYSELKQEHANAIGADVPDNQNVPGNHDVPENEEKQQGSGERELSFVKDASRGNHAGMKLEQAEATGKELNFVKDQSPGLSQGR